MITGLAGTNPEPLEIPAVAQCSHLLALDPGGHHCPKMTDPKRSYGHLLPRRKKIRIIYNTYKHASLITVSPLGHDELKKHGVDHSPIRALGEMHQAHAAQSIPKNSTAGWSRATR